MSQSGDPRDLTEADETAAPSDEPERTLSDDVEGDARLEEEQAMEQDGPQDTAPGSLGGDNGGA